MKGFSKQIILTLSLLLYVVRVSAQGVSSFPVQVSAQITSPSVYLSDYVSGFEDRATVVLVNRDVMSTGIDVRLRMTVRCQNGLMLRTKPSAVFEAVTLYPGMSERLGAAELSPYFELRNLDVTGTMFQGAMPEGLATFTFEAVEYHTGVVVSTPYTTVTNLTINKPPALLYPKNGIVMRPLSARSFQLQWQPRHSYSGAGVMYEITIKEIADTLSNPTSAYNYSQTIYQTETASTSLTYSLSEPELEEGKRYGWCVRAYSVEGTVHFTNGGYSEVFTFDVRHPDGYDVHDTVTVKRKEDRDPFDKSPERISRCGEDSYTVTDLTPAEHLEVGDTITVGGGFKVVVTSLTQSGSTFSGEGYMFIPYIGVDFTVDIRNIQVNASRQLISGYTEVRCDMSGSQIGGTDMLLQGGGKRLKNGVVLPDLSVGFLLTDVSGAEYDSVTGTLTLKDENGSVIGTIETPRNEQGEPVFPIRVKDNDGNLVQIEEETDTDSRPTGRYKFTPLGRQTGKYISESQLSGIRGDLGTVTFEKDDSGVFTFDSPLKYYETVALLLNSDGANGGGRIYRRMSNCDQYYDVPWLFIGEGCTEQVRARLKLTGSGKKEIPKPEDIQFIVSDEGGVTVLPSTYNADGTYSVTVAASQADSRQTVHAVYMVGDRCYQLGMLDVDTRAPMRDSVCLVNLGGSYSASQIETELNAIYGRVGVTWNVTEEDGFSYPKDSIAHLFDSKSKALELYNSHQKNLNRAFEAYLGDRYDGKTCYLFMMPANGSGSKRELAGFMPRGEQYGYINTDAVKSENLPAVIAHELGHGKYRLRHTFDSEYGSGAASRKGQTDNLMDYTSSQYKSTHIAKWQWNQIYNPALLTEVWERDEDSELLGFASLEQILELIHEANVKKLSYVSLNSKDNKLNSYNGPESKDYLFKLAGKEYSSSAPIVMNYYIIPSEQTRGRYKQLREYTTFTFHKALLDDYIKTDKYKKSDEELFSIAVPVEQQYEFCNYLFSPIEVYNNGKAMQIDETAYISDVPEMPKITIKSNNGAPCKMKMEIVFNNRRTWTDKKGTHSDILVRNDTTCFISKELQPNDEWNVNWEGKFRGGQVNVYCIENDSNVIGTFSFKILGKNPSLEMVLNYAMTKDNSWYVPKIIRHESGSNSVGKQFDNNGNPLWGYPYGWGLKQLDNLGEVLGYKTIIEDSNTKNLTVRYGASPDELWNWKMNVAKGIELFKKQKMSLAKKKWKTEISGIQQWIDIHGEFNLYLMKVKSKKEVFNIISLGDDSYFEKIVAKDNPDNDLRSLIDADAVHLYNGGHYMMYIELPIEGEYSTPVWILSNDDNYLNAVCKQRGWY